MLSGRELQQESLTVLKSRVKWKTDSESHSLCAGCFLFCWTPFFVVHTTRALCSTCNIPPGLMSTVTWLGYINSAVNPVIYTVFNAEFKKFFKKCLRSCCRRLDPIRRQ